ncbi:MAG: type II secretion system protein J [Oligoflexales bacterium]
MEIKHSKQAGFTLVSVMIYVAIASSFAVMSARLTGQSELVLRTLNKESDLMDLRHYLRNNFSCQVTKTEYTSASASVCPGTLTEIDTYRENEELLTDSAGTMYADKYDIHAKCQGNEFHFFYEDDDGTDRHLFNNIPISCADQPYSELQVMVDDVWYGVCCVTDGASPELSDDFCEWRESGRRLIDETNNLELECLENGNNPIPCTCVSGSGEAFHSVGRPAPINDKHIEHSLKLDGGGPIFPNNGRETCASIMLDGTMEAVWSSDGVSGAPIAIGSNHPNHGSWDFTTEEWLESDDCHHFKLLNEPGY